MAVYLEKFASPHYVPLDLSAVYNRNVRRLGFSDCSEQALKWLKSFPAGHMIYMGIPFTNGATSPEASPNMLLLKDEEAVLPFAAGTAYRQIVLLHAADFPEDVPDPDGIYRPMRGNPPLGELVAEYELRYADGTVQSFPIKRRFQIGELDRPSFGEYCFEASPHWKPHAIGSSTEDVRRGRQPEVGWGHSQWRTRSDHYLGPPFYWLHVLESSRPEAEWAELAMLPRGGTAFIFAASATHLSEHSLRWETRKKAVVHLPGAERTDEFDRYDEIDLDLGTVISVLPTLDYNHSQWESGYHNQLPTAGKTSVIVEYTAHPDAKMYIGEHGRYGIALRDIREPYGRAADEGEEARQPRVQTLPAAVRRVGLIVKDQATGKPVPVRLHVHGEAGEYLPPMNRHRMPNPYFLEDYGVEYVHEKMHNAAYIDGRTELMLPLGVIYVEVSKGFEIAPVKRRFTIDGATDCLEIELVRVLPWRDRGWITADPHVHWISPQAAGYEGEAEDVNVVDVLATQWSELFSNVGDFDGRTTFGSRENGGSGRYLVRVGTENRQHILGHISLIGYEGDMILPLAAGGPDEGALGEAISVTLTQWAEQCKRQGGITVLNHFPEPRAEGAASIVLGAVDAVEMTSWHHVYKGINPYSLSDWYRFLNCGFQVAALGGTDKMSASTAIGTIRTYARIRNREFDYDSWKDAVRRGETFVTFGPLMELHIAGQPMGGRVDLPRSGGTLDVGWEASTVTVPITRVELIVNGEIHDVYRFDRGRSSVLHSCSLRMERSGWAALRIRGGYPDKPEVIVAHSSAIMIRVEGSPCFQYPDALTILEQIEGTAAFVRTLGTRAYEKAFKQALMTLTAAHRKLHNRLHQLGYDHNHTPVDDHHHKSSDRK